MYNWKKYIRPCFFLAFISTPIALIGLGVRPDAIENRDLADKPLFSLESIFDIDFYQSTSEYLEDHFPLRSLLIRTNSMIDLYLLRSSPSDEVVIGKEKWLFMTNSLRWPCESGLSPDQLFSPISRLAGVLEEHGKSFHVIFAPNKSSVYPQYLPGAMQKIAECADLKREETRQYINNNGQDFDVIQSWSAFQDESRYLSSPLFPPLGRHWDSAGGILLAELIVRHLDPTIWDEDAVIYLDKASESAELPSRFMNLEIKQIRDQFIVQRSDVEIERKAFNLHTESKRKSTISNSKSATQEIIEGRTLVIHDSFLDESTKALEQYMDELYLVHWSQLEFQDELVGIIADSEHIVFEVVEDHRYFQLSKVDDSFLEKLASRLNQSL